MSASTCLSSHAKSMTVWCTGSSFRIWYFCQRKSRDRSRKRIWERISHLLTQVNTNHSNCLTVQAAFLTFSSDRWRTYADDRLSRSATLLIQKKWISNDYSVIPAIRFPLELLELFLLFSLDMPWTRMLQLKKIPARSQSKMYEDVLLRSGQVRCSGYKNSKCY